MKIPGFTAEASLYKAGESHYMNGMQAALITDREVIPQGVKYCIDANGRLYICGIDLTYKPYQWWKRWPDLLDRASLVGKPGPEPWRERLLGTALSMQEMI